MKNIARTVIIAGVVALSAVVASAPAMAGKRDGERRGGLSRLDTDGDKAVSQEELLVHSQRHFDRLDVNSDGMISTEEFNARLTTMFARLDANEDGVIAGDEFPRHHGRHHKGGKHRRGWGFGWFGDKDES